MDYDALRRGQRTVNVVFDAATSSLAGDALQSLACATLAQASCDAEAGMAMLRELATAAGSRGMCGGQALDIDATGAVSPLHVRSEEHTSELQSLMRISYAVFCLKKKTNKQYKNTTYNIHIEPLHKCNTQHIKL